MNKKQIAAWDLWLQKARKEDTIARSLRPHVPISKTSKKKNDSLKTKKNTK